VLLSFLNIKGFFQTFLISFASFPEVNVTIDTSRTVFCIRTKEVIPFNPVRPYSKGAYNTWTKYGSNKTYQEKYLHNCESEGNWLYLELFTIAAINQIKAVRKPFR